MLADQYRRQAAWRSWNRILDALPPLAGQTVLDLGCAIGDQAALLAARGARVLGIDANPELLAAARSREIPGASFREVDLRTFTGPGESFDGLWCSFTAAYFPNLPSALKAWTTNLRPGGWIALTEVDDLFAHEPVHSETRRLLEAYEDESLAADRYDFRMGRRLVDHIRAAGLSVTQKLNLPDRELSFEGPALLEVLEAWRARFDRMQLLRKFCGARFELVRDDFLQCLGSVDHRASARVFACFGRKQPQPPVVC
jgi:SAM-dependent methyltransferase